MANDFKIRKGLIVLGSGSSTPTDIYGSQGELFSITDSLSGSLFSVNDISGIPVIEAFSNNWVNLGTFNNEGLKVRGNTIIATGSLLGTSSYATQALSSSYALTASYALNGGGGGGGITGTGTAGQVTYWSGTSVVTGTADLTWNNTTKVLAFSNGGTLTNEIRVSSINTNTIVGRAAGSSASLTGIYNSFFGTSAGQSNTTGNYNSFFGVNAGLSNTTGQQNSFFGVDAGLNNTTGQQNNFFGFGAGYSNTTGSYNTFCGVNAGRSNTTGGFNSFFGFQAGYYNTTGINNSFFGISAGFNNTTGNENSFFGFGVGFNNTTGSRNSFFGTNAGLSNTTGGDNNFFGYNAGQSNTTGGSNNFFGVSAGYSNTTGESNNFFGVSAGYSNTTGIQNSFFGDATGFYNEGSGNCLFGFYSLALGNGDNNSFFGSYAGTNINSGASLSTSNNSVFLGYDTRANGNSQTNQVVIGYQGRGLGSNTTVIGNTSTTQTHLHGSLTVGTTTSGGRATFRGSGTTSATTALLVQNSTPSELFKILDDGNANFGYDLTVNGVFKETVTTNRQAASYTLALADRGKLVEMNVASANNLTVPLNSSIAFPVGTKIDIVQYGAGQTTIVATGGVTLRSTNNWTKINARYGAVTLVKIATDEWYLFGNLNA